MQYIHWLSGVFQGDFGISLKYKMAGYASDSAADWQYINFGLNRLYSGYLRLQFCWQWFVRGLKIVGWIKSFVKVKVLSVIIFLRFGSELY